ncbi:MAG TPA: hypothetical protein VM912_16695 [Terriglobales bacterium]|nr:hypothetical protein [Terriglobales bacterium]
MRKHHALAIAPDETRGNIELKEVFECLARHGPREDITANDDVIYLLSANLVEDSFERREIAMDVVERCDSNSKPSCAPIRPISGALKGQRSTRAV